MEKRKRRTTAQTLLAVKRIKTAVANGKKLGWACEKYKMNVAQYHAYKNKVWPETVEKKEKKPTTQDVVNKFNNEIERVLSEIKELEKKTTSLIYARDAYIDLMEEK